MALHFHQYAADAEHFVKEVAAEIGTTPDVSKADRQLRAVLHALRDRLAPSESLQLIAQLPMLIKAIYVDGWRISEASGSVRRRGDFIETVRAAGGKATHDDFTTDYEVEKAIHAVFKVLKRHVSKGEIDDIVATLPADLKPLLAEA